MVEKLYYKQKIGNFDNCLFDMILFKKCGVVEKVNYFNWFCMYVNENKIKFDMYLGLENVWLFRNQIRIRFNCCEGIKGMMFKVFIIF